MPTGSPRRKPGVSTVAPTQGGIGSLLGFGWHVASQRCCGSIWVTVLLSSHHCSKVSLTRRLETTDSCLQFREVEPRTEVTELVLGTPGCAPPWRWRESPSSHLSRLPRAGPPQGQQAAVASSPHLHRGTPRDSPALLVHLERPWGYRGPAW